MTEGEFNSELSDSEIGALNLFTVLQQTHHLGAIDIEWWEAVPCVAGCLVVILASIH